MTDTETVNEPVQEKVAEQPVQEQVNETVEQVQEEQVKQVPLTHLQKERKKRQDADQKREEAEQRLRAYEDHYLNELNKAKTQEVDETQYEPQTKAEAKAEAAKTKAETLRAVQESIWIKDNPELAELVNEKLPDFLKQRPNYSAAIDGAVNRYEEAWTLMDKFNPKPPPVVEKKPQPKKDAPGSPGTVPKGSGINQTISFSQMSDKEYLEWRKSVKRRR